ncbi:MAG TPA: hypothetical protein VJB89_02120 [Candidatus Nanoarchaeia archaeon]|nr:hypothetical protein [Candidatus Nanoarchaeia archaeon]
MALNFNIGPIVESLQDMGIYDYLLPFILIFAIIFAILEKTKVLGSEGTKPKTNINALVAIVIGLLLIVNQNIVYIINSFLPKVSLLIIILLMGLLVIAMLAGKEFKGLQGSVFAVAFIISIIAIIISLTPDLSIPGLNLSQSDKEQLLGIGVLVGIILLVYFLITSGGKKEPGKGESGWKKFVDALNDGVKE